MEEAKAAILAIVDPLKAELNAVYKGRVVNITKFNLRQHPSGPGRPGPSPSSVAASGSTPSRTCSPSGRSWKCVDEIDDKGKVSLAIGGEPERGGAAGGVGAVATDGNGSAVVSVSFEDVRRRAGPGGRRPRPQPGARRASVMAAAVVTQAAATRGRRRHR